MKRKTIEGITMSGAIWATIIAVIMVMAIMVGCSDSKTYIYNPTIIENPGQNGCPNQSGRCDTIQVFMGDSHFWEHSQHGR